MSNYRSNFTAATTAQRYDQIYSGGDESSFTKMVTWEREKQILDELVAEFKRGDLPNPNYLDFACGTGRVISYLEREMSESTGIEISQSMLDLCAARTERSKLICADITKSDGVEGQYDFITAFRFFLKADAELRSSAMTALAARLRDDKSWLVFNNHGRVPDDRFVRSIAQSVRKRRVSMSDREVLALVHDAGLRVVRRIAYEYLPSRLAFSFSHSLGRRVEQASARVPMLSGIGGSAIYVVTLA